jgi:UDP-N-acetylglucosamine--N-acetylmuramyl-(pentapeptide) pyrophosphoryl-undecaprenol N-acetylglucosamine transferase
MRVLIAGGGTGGHLFPGIALAEEVCTRKKGNEAVFVGTNRGLEARVVPSLGFTLETLSTQGLKGKGGLALIKALVVLPFSFLQAWRILRKHRPDVVVGVGGYASGPVVLAAWMQKVPTCIQEQNALPGMTNRILGRFVKVVFTAFEQAASYFPPRKVQCIGNPIRAKLLENFLRPSAPQKRFSLLVFGGSLGARAVNRLVVGALEKLEDLKEQLEVLHQTGKADVAEVRAAYEKQGFQARVVEFIDDMAEAYARASLVICRAGATTVAELTVCKKASILIPFPHATDNHQEVNAQAMVESGAALMFREAELTGEKLAQAIRELKGDPERLQRMERQAGLLGRPEAAKELADVCAELMRKAYGPTGRKRP